MEFSNKLKEYIQILNCSAKDLSDAAGISPTVISRYKNGDRIPKPDSTQLNNLIKGLVIIAKNKNIAFSEDNIREVFYSILNKDVFDYETFTNNLGKLINKLKINMADLSRYLGFDSSYLSKIKSGTRKPTNTDDFAKAIVKYVINNYNNNESREAISRLISKNVTNNSEYYEYLYSWLTLSSDKELIQSSQFLKTLDDFDLNEYIKAIHFDTMKVPNIPYFGKTKNYYGIEQMKKGQIECLKGIVLSKSKDDVFFYSSMPMEDLAEDKDFSKKWMIGLAMMLKKGLHLNMVHNLNRPFNELMLGLESWIPLYMTGQISPYYFRNHSDELFSHIECSGGTIALSGECIGNNQNKGKYYLTNKKDEVKYYREKANQLLRKATPLMSIYKSEQKEKFSSLLQENSLIEGDRRNILYKLPIYTLSKKLLQKILDHNKVSEKNRKLILDYYEQEKKNILNILKKNKIVDEISEISKQNFINNCTSLSISNLFIDQKIEYTYEEYLEHLKLTKEFKDNNKNYNCKIRKKQIFSNINIYIVSQKQVIISKENSPIIHFVINHPDLINAIENFEAPYVEK